MKKRHLQTTLRRLAGHLVVETDEQRRNVDVLYKALGEADVPDDERRAIQSDFSIGKADFFFDDTIPKRRLEELDAIARKIERREEEPRSLVFVREVPIRESLLHASVPNWAAGARVSQSVGPFVNKDGRRFWFDFYPVAKLTALYVQGIAEPALLYKEDPRRREAERRIRARAGRDRVQTRQGKRLDQCALPGHRRTRGLVRRFDDRRRPDCAERGARRPERTADGSRQRDGVRAARTRASPRDRRGRRRVRTGLTRAICSWICPAASPSTFRHRVTRSTRLATRAGNSTGRSCSSRDVPTTPRRTTRLLQRVLVPFAASEGAAPHSPQLDPSSIPSAAQPDIVRSAWALPIAAIDITQPPEAQGTGAMLVQTNQGLVDAWPKLQGGGLHLAHPAFLVSPGSILLADFTNGNPHARQSLQLWRDELE